MDALGIAIVAFGLGIAFALALRWLPAGATPRELELERELEVEREHSAMHREAVEKHFQRTALLFQDVSYHHALLYRHLSEGMTDLCENTAGLLGADAERVLLEPQTERSSRAAAMGGRSGARAEADR